MNSLLKNQLLNARLFMEKSIYSQCLFSGAAALKIEDYFQNSDLWHEKCGETATMASSSIPNGTIIGDDFLTLRKIGSGGMATVYLSHQISFDRPAALKILSERYAENRSFIMDFIREARAAAKLNHPHIIRAYAVGEDEGFFYFAMEHIDGENIKSLLRRKGYIPFDMALVIIRQIAEALDYAWKEQRLIHRDVKPENIMMTKSGCAKLLDLGLARIAGEPDNIEEDEVMGTPQYISPELISGDPVDGRSDIYSLGATFYHMISGQFPFNGQDALQIAKKHIEEPLISPKLINPKIPDSICCITAKMMEKNPNDRYQSAEELVEDISRLQKKKSVAPIPRHKNGRIFFLPQRSAKL